MPKAILEPDEQADIDFFLRQKARVDYREELNRILQKKYPKQKFSTIKFDHFANSISKHPHELPCPQPYSLPASTTLEKHPHHEQNYNQDLLLK